MKYILNPYFEKGLSLSLSLPPSLSLSLSVYIYIYIYAEKMSKVLSDIKHNILNSKINELITKVFN